MLDSFSGNNREKFSDSDISAIVKDVNKSLPRVIDEKTILKSFFISSTGEYLVYEYEFKDLKSSFTNSMILKLTNEVSFRSCSDPSVIKMASIKSGLIYQYRDKTGDFLTAFKVTPELCMKINSPNYLEYIGTSGGTSLYIYNEGRMRIGDLVSAATLHEGRPYYTRGVKTTSIKFNMEFDCRRGLYKINRVSSFSKSFGVDLSSEENKIDGWKILSSDFPLIQMARDHLCK